MSEWVLEDAENIRVNLTKEQENEISMLYRQVYLQIRKQMLSIPKDGTVSEQLRRQYLNELHKQLDEAYKSIGIGLEKKIEKEAQKAAQGVVDDANTFMEKLNITVKGAYSFVPKDIVNALISGKVYAGNWSLSSAIWTDINKHQSDINKIIAEGLAANKSAYDIAKDLEKYVNPSAAKPWDWSKVYPGTNKKVDYNAQRLARTLVSHAYQQSLERVCKNNPFVTGYIWQSAHSSRVCIICAQRDGQFFKKGELPLDHPNGMCTFIAEIEGDMADIADRLADWVKGGEDSELDKWMSDMTGAKIGPVFNDLQNKWLKPLGYTPEKMPTTFKEFMEALTWEQTNEFLELSGGSWSNTHPYQVMEKYYTEHLLSVRNGVIPIPKPASVMRAALRSEGVPDSSEWINLIRQQRESTMLELEEESMQLIGQQGKEGIRIYSGSSYSSMNAYLRYRASGMSESEAISRSGISQENLVAVQNAIAGLGRAQTTRALVLRRGTDLGDLAGLLPGDFNANLRDLEGMTIEELNNKFQGAVGTYASFTSTSSLWGRGFSGSVEIVFYAPAGTSASSIMSISRYGTREGETLLNASTTVRVLSVEESDGHMDSRIRVYMEIIP